LNIIGHFSDVQYRTIKNINIVATDVKNDCLIYELKLDRLRLHSVEFFKTTLEKLYIKDELELDKSKFDKRLDFFDVEYLGKLNLAKTLISNDTSFLTLSSNNIKRNIVNVKNRETARIIKNSFEQQNNIIEANKYYAVEMKEREKELKVWKNPLDWLVFTFHMLSSNHSQNWIFQFWWILLISFFYVSVPSDHSFCEGIYHRINLGCDLFDKMANVINPFSIMRKGETLNLGMLIFKVIIAYLIYQFVVSIRQNTRRK
jgi:hypothetical protein